MHGSIGTASGRKAPEKIGRRSAARLRLSAPAKLQTTLHTFDCMLVNISQTGARIAIERPLEVGEFAILKCAQLEEYADIVRSGFGHNGLRFDQPLSQEQILAIRAHSEDVGLHERSSFRREVQNWVAGRR